MKRSRVRADHGCDLVCRFDQHANFSLSKYSRLLGLHNENALQNPTVDERHAQEGAVDLLPGFPEVLKARVIPGVLHGYRHYLFRVG